MPGLVDLIPGIQGAEIILFKNQETAYGPLQSDMHKREQQKASLPELMINGAVRKDYYFFSLANIPALPGPSRNYRDKLYPPAGISSKTTCIRRNFEIKLCHSA
jgi:hypothetical protein